MLVQNHGETKGWRKKLWWISYQPPNPPKFPPADVLCYTVMVNTCHCHSQLSNIKTHDSESRGQEEAGRTRRMSVLFTGSTAVKFVNALNKPPLKLSLSYQRLSTFQLYRISNPTMEEIGATNPE